MYLKHPLILAGLETSLDKDTTYQGRGVGIRKTSKENEDTSENNEQKHRIVWE